MKPSTTSFPLRVTIVGGGYAGASAALQLVRRCPDPVAITIIEPRPQVGPGLAYSATDPDHRLNGTPATHWLDPSAPWEFQAWCDERGIVVHDPEARTPEGRIFARRADFGAFIAEQVHANAARPNGSTIRHLRTLARGASHVSESWQVSTADGNVLASDLLLVATGNPNPRLPSPFAASLDAHPSIVLDPLIPDWRLAIPKSARVLVLGSGLTALDAVSTLLRTGHDGPITVVSRRGLRPRPQRPPIELPVATSPTWVLERIEGDVPVFVKAAGRTPSLRTLMKGLRMHISETVAQGATWHAAFDDLRDVVWQVWPTLPVQEQKRFLRQLRTWYDAHRFRAPPQNDAMLREAEREGRVAFLAARIHRAEADAAGGPVEIGLTERGAKVERSAAFDVVVNCTGLDPQGRVNDNPFLGSLLDSGYMCIDACGIGIAVDAQCRAIGTDGRAEASLRVIGPPTLGTFGDQLGGAFIAAQIHRIVPDLLATFNEQRSRRTGRGA